jgi:hypothetical protein
MSEITVSFRIRLPSSKKIQIQEVVEDEEEHEVIKNTNENFLPIQQTNGFHDDDERVSLSRSPVLANGFHEVEDDQYSENRQGEPCNEHAVKTGEDIDTDSESEYEYEEVTVTDESEGEDEEEDADVDVYERHQDNGTFNYD